MSKTLMNGRYTINKDELTAKGNVVEMNRKLDSLYLSADVVVLHFVAEVSDGWVSRVVGAEDFDCFLHSIRLVDVVDCNGCSA